MDDTANKTQDNDLNLVPPEETPLKDDTSPTNSEDGALGASLDPSKFDSSDPLLNGTNISAAPVQATPSFVEEKHPTKTKVANKGLIIAIITTLVNLAICATAIIVCLNITKSDTATGNSNQTAEQEPELPGTLQCEVKDCIANLRLDATPDQITSQLGIEPNISSTAYAIASGITLNVYFESSGTRYSYYVKDETQMPGSSFTSDDIATLGEHLEEWKLEDVTKLLGEGCLVGHSSFTKTYAWYNHEDEFYTEIGFDLDGTYDSKPYLNKY